MADYSLTIQPDEDEFTPEPEDVEEAPGALSLRTSLGVLLSSNSGRAGVAMMIGMLLISIYVIASYPRDFGRTRWTRLSHRAAA